MIRSRFKIFYHDLLEAIRVIAFYVKTVWENFIRLDLFFYASSLSFQVVLCLIPTLFLLVWILGSVLSPETLIRQIDIVSSFALPREMRYTDNVRNLILDRARIFTEHRSIFGLLGLIGFMWTSLALMVTVRKVVFTILGVANNSSFLRQMLYDFRVLLIAGFFLTTSTFLTTIFTGLREVAMQLPPGEMRITLIRFLVPLLFALVLTFFLYFSIYRFLSYGKIKSSAAAFGAFWAALFYEFAKDLFALYVTHVGNLVLTYGTLEAIFGSILWIFYSTVVFIIGVELAKINSMRRALA